MRLHEDTCSNILKSIEKPIDLSSCLNCSVELIQQLINDPPYKQFQIAKKRGGFRQILSPHTRLKKLQCKLNTYLQGYYALIKPPIIHGFTIRPSKLKKSLPYCNIVANAKRHAGQRFVMNLDLKNFFPSIHVKQVKELFLSNLFGYTEQIATALALLTTYKGYLPTGAPTSPVISNFICLDLDEALIQVCKQHQIRYTRYADDLTFSSNNYFTQELKTTIFDIIQRHHFQINFRKFRIRSKNAKQTVTGLVVNEKVNLERHFYKRIRAMLHDLSTNGLAQAAGNHFGKVNMDSAVDMYSIEKFINRLRGYIDFMGQVKGRENEKYLKMKVIFDACPGSHKRRHYR